MRDIPTKYTTLEQAYARAQMTGYILQKREKFDRVELVKELPPLTYFGDSQVWLGTWTRTSVEMGEKFIVKYPAVSLDLKGEVYASPSEIARAWIYTHVKKPLRANRKQWEHWNKYDTHYPFLARAGIYPKMIYLDLKSAYWSILQVVGWGAEYFENMIVRRYPVNNFPFPEHKLARNCLVTACLPTPAQVWHNGEIKQRHSKGMINLGLYKLVNDILQAIALDMLEFEPVYIHTDGYIIPQHHAENAVRKIDEAWGLLLTERYKGDAIIYGVGEYTIGARRAGRARGFSKPANGLIPAVPRKMLQKYFRWLSDLFPPEYPLQK